MQVTLSHAPNPDIGGGYWDGVIPDTNNTVVEVEDLAHASRVCRGFIEEWGLGGGNWTGGQVSDGDEEVAKISYNGRAWKPGPWPTDEIER